jgi:fructose-bisphosphate aldolase class I
LLLQGLKERIALLGESEKIVLKLTLPEEANLYKDLLAMPNVLRIAALSGGYSREIANKKLRENSGLIASFSRALTEGLAESASDEEFNMMLDQSISSIFQASQK